MDTVPSKEYCRILPDEDEDEDDMFSDACTNDSNKLWENGIIPFVFDKNVSSELKGISYKAMDGISRVSSMKFIEKGTGQTDFIKFVDEQKFSSYVGRKGGEQKLWVTINTETWPSTIGSCMHELLHALGFYHEHCRPDRDKHVIVKRTGNNYDKLEESKMLCFGPYDELSIMHYSNKQGVESNSGNVKMGQREELSNGDIDALKKLYLREKILRSRKEELKRGKKELERVLKRLPVDNERLENKIQILEERSLMNLPQTSGLSM